MSDEHQTLFAQNTSIEAVAVSNVTAIVASLALDDRLGLRSSPKPFETGRE